MEKKIAQAFIYKNRRERFLFDLKKKRFNAICNLPRIIDDSLKIMKSNQLPDPEELIKIMREHGVGDQCFVLSEYAADGYDGVFLPLDDVVHQLRFNGFPALIVGLPSGFSHLRDESYASHQPNCFVKPKIPFDKDEYG